MQTDRMGHSPKGPMQKQPCNCGVPLGGLQVPHMDVPVLLVTGDHLWTCKDGLGGQTTQHNVE